MQLSPATATTNASQTASPSVCWMASVPSFRKPFDPGKNIGTAVAAAKQADVVILGLGEWQGISGEGFDRSSLDLPGNQEQLLEAIVATGKPVVLVLQNGRPLTIGWAKEHVPA